MTGPVWTEYDFHPPLFPPTSGLRPWESDDRVEGYHDGFEVLLDSRLVKVKPYAPVVETSGGHELLS